MLPINYGASLGRADQVNRSSRRAQTAPQPLWSKSRLLNRSAPKYHRRLLLKPLLSPKPRANLPPPLKKRRRRGYRRHKRNGCGLHWQRHRQCPDRLEHQPRLYRRHQVWPVVRWVRSDQFHPRPDRDRFCPARASHCPAVFGRQRQSAWEAEVRLQPRPDRRPRQRRLQERRRPRHRPCRFGARLRVPALRDSPRRARWCLRGLTSLLNFRNRVLQHRARP